MTRLALHALRQIEREGFMLAQEFDPRALAQLKDAKLVKVAHISGVRVYVPA